MAPLDAETKLLDQWLEAGRMSGDPDAILIKRAFPRTPIFEYFSIKSTARDGLPETEVKGYNISSGGLGVIHKTPIPAGITVRIHCELDTETDPWITAKVIHCTKTIGYYKIGLEFQL